MDDIAPPLAESARVTDALVSESLVPEVPVSGAMAPESDFFVVAAPATDESAPTPGVWRRLG